MIPKHIISMRKIDEKLLKEYDQKFLENLGVVKKKDLKRILALEKLLKDFDMSVEKTEEYKKFKKYELRKHNIEYYISYLKNSKIPHAQTLIKKYKKMKEALNYGHSKRGNRTHKI